MFPIPHQSSVSLAYTAFDEDAALRPPSYCDRIGYVLKELVRLPC